MQRLTSLTLAFTSVLAPIGCIDAPPPVSSAPSDAAAATAPRFAVEIRDRNGRVSPALAPTWPQLRIAVDAPIVDPAAFLLLRGVTREDAVDDLERAPLRASTRDGAVATTRRVEDDAVVLEPLAHLIRGERLLVAAAPWSVESDAEVLPFVHEIAVDDAPEAGAWAARSWPADATHAVPRGLAFAAVRFDGRLVVGEDDVALVGPEGAAPGTSRPVSCTEIGWRDGTCVRFDPTYPLLRGATYRVVVSDDLVDLTGAPAGPFSAELVTATLDPPPASFDPPACTADEALVGPVCIFVDDRRAVIRARASAPARFFARAAGLAAFAVGARGEATLGFRDLDADTDLAISLSLVDLAGNEESRVVRVRTAPALPEIDISEVCSDPEEREPAQEWVELLNSGAMPIDLAGYALADREDRAGDIVERAAVVPAGGRALLVSDAFDPDLAAVPGGIPLVRMGTSLASGGLSNAGEPLFLRDAEGRRVSAAPALSTGAGRCLYRLRGVARSGAEEAFEVGPCTPGRPP